MSEQQDLSEIADDNLAKKFYLKIKDFSPNYRCNSVHVFYEINDTSKVMIYTRDTYNKKTKTYKSIIQLSFAKKPTIMYGKTLENVNPKCVHKAIEKILANNQPDNLISARVSQICKERRICQQ